MIGNGNIGIDPRFTDSVLSVLRFICQTKPMVAEEDRIAIDGGLVRICEKSEIITLCESIRALAADIILVLRYSYGEDPGCASMAVRLEEAERNLVAMLDDVRTCLLSCNDKK